MKIDGQVPKLPVNDKNVQKNQEKGTIERDKIDQQRLAELAKTKNSKFAVTRLKNRIQAEPDINMDKVNALKAKIKNGEYQIDSKRLADNMLKESLIDDIES